jgi:hypothetical protein
MAHFGDALFGADHQSVVAGGLAGASVASARRWAGLKGGGRDGVNGNAQQENSSVGILKNMSLWPNILQLAQLRSLEAWSSIGNKFNPLFA